MDSRDLRSSHGIRVILLAGLLGATICGGVGAQQTAVSAPEPIAVGTSAPDFTLLGATRYGVLARPVQLRDFKGKTVVLAFFPKARTSGCTIQMQAYRDKYATLFKGGRDVVLIAISSDLPDTLAAWARDAEFPFLFASDTGMVVGKAYGAGPSRWGYENRILFVVDGGGKIAYRQTPFREIDPTAYDELAAGLEKVLPH